MVGRRHALTREMVNLIRLLADDPNYQNSEGYPSINGICHHLTTHYGTNADGGIFSWTIVRAALYGIHGYRAFKADVPALDYERPRSTEPPAYNHPPRDEAGDVERERLHRTEMALLREYAKPNPTLAQVAAKSGIKYRDVLRLAKGRAPKSVYGQKAMDTALALLGQRRMALTEIAAECGVSKSTVTRVAARLREEGKLDAGTTGS